MRKNGVIDEKEGKWSQETQTKKYKGIQEY